MTDSIMDIIREATTSSHGEQPINPMRILLNKPGFEVVVIIPTSFSRINSWELGRLVRKSIKGRLEETRNPPYIRKKMPNENEMIRVMEVPEDFDRMGNWDLGTYVKAKFTLKEMEKK